MNLNERQESVIINTLTYIWQSYAEASWDSWSTAYKIDTILQMASDCIPETQIEKDALSTFKDLSYPKQRKLAREAI